MKIHPHAAAVRKVIAAYRDWSNASPIGLGYGPDWRKRIKPHVISHLEHGSVPYFMERRQQSLAHSTS